MSKRLVALLLLAIPALVHAAAFESMNYSENLSGASIGRVYRVSTAQAVATTAEVFSDELSMQAVNTFGLSGSCTGSAPDVKLEWQSANVADTANFVTTATIVASVTGTITPAAFSPPPSLYGRVKLTGIAANGANTVCTLDVFLQGD